MKDAIEFIKNKRSLSADYKKALIKEVENNGNFIATSRKYNMTCTCGETQTVWTTSGSLGDAAFTKFSMQHFACEGSGPTYLMELN